MADLLDVNVLLALLHARHWHSRRAVAWLETRGDPGAIRLCRVVQMGALRLLTTRTVMQNDVLTAAEFWQGWDRLLRDDRFTLVQEPPALETAWRQLSRALPRGQVAGTDTYLAALAKARGWRLVTFDRGFTAFPGLEVEVLA